MEKFYVTNTTIKGEMPKWIGIYLHDIELFIESLNGCSHKKLSLEKDEFFRYDLMFENNLKMFIAIMRTDNDVNFHIDVEMFTQARSDIESCSKLVYHTLNNSWMLKYPFRTCFNDFGGFSLCSVGSLKGLNRDYFNEILQNALPCAESIIIASGLS